MFLDSDGDISKRAGIGYLEPVVPAAAVRTRGLASVLLLSLAASGGAARAARPPAVRDLTVTVATWNIAWFGDGVNDEVLRGNRRDGRYIRDGEHLTRLGAIVTHLEELGTDVVALQEIENEAAGRRLFPAADWDLHVSGRDTDPAWSQRTAIAVRRAAGWRVERHPDIVEWSPRGLDRYGVNLTLRRGSERVRVLTVHFEAGCAGAPLDSGRRDCGFLRMQGAVLKGWLHDRREEGVPVIVAGDWNRFLSRGDERLPPWFPADPLVLPSPGSSPGCWGGRFPNYVDHILAFVPPGGEVTPTRFEELLYDAPRAMRDGLSDHCALVGTLTFR